MTRNLLEAYSAIALLPIPACQCGGFTCHRDDLPIYESRLARNQLRYTCATCYRSIPYCYGAADAMLDSCDDCWCATYGQEANNV